MFSVIDFNVLFSYLFFLMFFFHLCHSIHVQTSIIFTETYFIIPYIVFHLCSIVAAKAKRFYAICIGLFTLVVICSTSSHSIYSAYLFLPVALKELLITLRLMGLVDVKRLFSEELQPLQLSKSYWSDCYLLWKCVVSLFSTTIVFPFLVTMLQQTLKHPN